MAFDKLSKGFSHFFAMDDPSDYESETDEMAFDTEDRSTPDPQTPRFRGSKVVSMNTPTGTPAKIVVIEPRIYSDAKEIGAHLLNNRAVVVNFDRIATDDATRIVDFLTGTTFAINGEIKRVGETIFLVTPANFQIDGNVAMNMDSDGLMSSH